MKRSAITHSLREYLVKEMCRNKRKTEQQKRISFYAQCWSPTYYCWQSKFHRTLVFLSVYQCQKVTHNYTAPKSLPNQHHMQGTYCIALLIQKDITFLVSFEISKENGRHTLLFTAAKNAIFFFLFVQCKVILLVVLRHRVFTPSQNKQQYKQLLLTSYDSRSFIV